jgi:hypothetical protein
LTAKKVNIVSDGMSYIILSGHCCDIVVLNVQSPRVDRVYLVNNSFYEAMEQVFVKFPKYHTKNFVRKFQCQSRWEDISKPKIGIENVHEISKKWSKLFYSYKFHRWKDNVPIA